MGATSACVDSRGHPVSARRLAWALGASAVLHAWLALELPATSGMPLASPPSLAVRLVPAVDPTSAAVVPPEGKPLALSRAAAIAGKDSQPTSGGASRASADDRHARARTQRRDAAPLVPREEAHYYPARELDVYPALLSPLELEYPEQALREVARGRVAVMLLIDAAGRVDDVAVMEAEPPGYFESAARKALQHARFSGARRNGMPVGSRVLVHVDFDAHAHAPVQP
jgi:protein TonB